MKEFEILQESFSAQYDQQVIQPRVRAQRILPGSSQAPGTMHDKKIMDEAHLSCTTNLQVCADSGFQGLSIGNAEIIIPFKRKRKKKDEPKLANSDAHSNAVPQHIQG